MSTEFTPEMRFDHCAVSFDNSIIIIGGWCRNEIISTRVIWSYNLYTEKWRKTEIPNTSCAPEPFEGAVAAAIDNTIYTFGGLSITITGHPSNELWKLSKTKEGCFTWSFNKPQCKEKSPSPRMWHTGWEYTGKLWIFGGYGASQEGYLNKHGHNEGSFLNNQLLCFDPNIKTWKNPQCFGSIPKPRAFHASAIINDKMWLYGGCNHNVTYYLGEMFELRMSSLTWSQIRTAQFHPKPDVRCTLTAAADDKLVLHGGCTKDRLWAPTWIMDLTSYSWREFTSREDHEQEWHTGSTGLNSSVIIICGRKSPLDDTHHMYSTIFDVMLKPKSLQQVAMQAIFKHQDELPLNCLPKKLLSLLDVSVKDQNIGSELDHVNTYISSSCWEDLGYFTIRGLEIFLVSGLALILARFACTTCVEFSM